MTKLEVAELLARVAASWSWKEIPAHTAQVWYEELADLRFDQAIEAVRAHSRESNFPPSIAEVRQRCGKAPREPLTPADHAALAAGRRQAAGTIGVFGLEKARQIIGPARMDELFPEHKPSEKTALEALLTPELGA